MIDQSKDMKDAVISSLKESGKLGKISAEVRAEVSLLLSRDSEKTRSIPLCRENLIINELIREYLTINGLKSTLSVFVPETGEPIDPIDRNFLAHSLNITPRETTPLLNSLIRKWRNNEQFKSTHNDNINNNLQQSQITGHASHTSNIGKDKNEGFSIHNIQNNQVDDVETGDFFEINSI